MKDKVMTDLKRMFAFQKHYIKRICLFWKLEKGDVDEFVGLLK